MDYMSYPRSHFGLIDRYIYIYIYECIRISTIVIKFTNLGIIQIIMTHFYDIKKVVSLNSPTYCVKKKIVEIDSLAKIVFKSHYTNNIYII